MQYTICCSHNVIFNKLYAIADGNMLYTIYNVQYVIWNPSVSCVKYCGFLNFETIPYTFILEPTKVSGMRSILVFNYLCFFEGLIKTCYFCKC